MIEEPTRSREPPATPHLCESIVNKVAAIVGKRPMDLPPIYEAIDMDALEQLFTGRVTDRGVSLGRVAFTYNDFLVVVESTGDVRVSPEFDRVRRPDATGSWDGQRDSALCESIVEAVCERSERELCESEPLYSVIDTDALTQLFEGAHERAGSPRTLEVMFHYQGYGVTILENGDIRVDDYRAG